MLVDYCFTLQPQRLLRHPFFTLDPYLVCSSPCSVSITTDVSVRSTQFDRFHYDLDVLSSTGVQSFLMSNPLSVYMTYLSYRFLVVPGRRYLSLEPAERVWYVRVFCPGWLLFHRYWWAGGFPLPCLPSSALPCGMYFCLWRLLLPRSPIWSSVQPNNHLFIYIAKTIASWIFHWYWRFIQGLKKRSSTLWRMRYKLLIRGYIIDFIEPCSLRR